MTHSISAPRQYTQAQLSRPAVTESARDRLIVALDLPTPDQNRGLVEELGSAVSFYKLGWGLLLRQGGNQLFTDLIRDGKQIFLDLKFFDVPNSVGVAVGAVAALGVRFVTVHGNREIIEAAVKARGDSSLKILAVTVLTSLNEQEARRMYQFPDEVTLGEHVVNVARDLAAFGCDGLIASAQEITRIRDAVPEGVFIASPGIRRKGHSTDDHQRFGTPYEAIRAGADYIVVGRPIYESATPINEAQEHVRDIERGLEDRGF